MKKIPLFKPYVSWLARLYVLKVLCGTQLAEGPVVKTFEREFAKYIRVPLSRIVAVNSGTTALELAYELAGIGPGDEVIAPVLTCTATNLPLVRRGARIVFADIGDDLNASLKDIERKITKDTKAIVWVNFGGYSGLLGQLMVLARRHGIKVIEDAAQSVGGPGPWGIADYTCVSLQAIKTLTAGDGGFLICAEPSDAYKASKLRWFGYDRALKQKLGDTDLELAGYKYHMNDISAAIGLGNLRSLERVLRKREEVRHMYREAFGRPWIHGLQIRYTPWLIIVLHPKAREIDKALKAAGIGSGPYHYRNDKYTIFGGPRRYIANNALADITLATFRELQEGGVVRIPGGVIAPIINDLPNMDLMENRYTLLPFHHGLSRKDVEAVVGGVMWGISGKLSSDTIDSAVSALRNQIVQVNRTDIIP